VRALGGVGIQNTRYISIVIPAQAGIHHRTFHTKATSLKTIVQVMDSRLRGNDDIFLLEGIFCMQTLTRSHSSRTHLPLLVDGG
jgi:hypothetical protein